MASALLLVAVLLAAAGAARGQAPPPERVAKNLAQNVLGEGTVRAVRVSPDGSEIDITWDAVLYRATATAARNREQLRGEAELATGSIMGVMRPRLIRFRMLVRDRPIARGQRTAEGLTISYAPELQR